MIYFARKHACEPCVLKPKCCPNVPARKIARSVHEAARDKIRAIAKTEAYAVSCREFEAHTQARSIAPPRPRMEPRTSSY